MSAVTAPGLPHRFLDATYVDSDFTSGQVDSVCAVSDDCYVVAAWNPIIGAHQLAFYRIFDAGTSKVGEYTWPSYLGTPSAADEFRMRPVASGKIVVFWATPWAAGGTGGPKASATILSVTLPARVVYPSLGTAWTYNPGVTTGTSDYQLLAASSSKVLLWECTLDNSGVPNNLGQYRTLAVSGTTLTSDATVAPGGSLARDRSVRLAGFLDTTYFVVAQGTAETSAKTLQLLTAGSGTLSSAGTASVTQSDSTSRWTSSPGQGLGFGLRKLVSGLYDDWLIACARSGSTPTYTATAIEVPSGSYGMGSASVKVDGDHVHLLQSTDSVIDGDDTPLDFLDPGDLYTVVTVPTVAHDIGLAVVGAARRYGALSASSLSADLGILAWAEQDAIGMDDTIIRTQLVATATDITGVDDVTSVITNYFGGEILQQWLLDNDSYLGLFTADPTVLGSLASEVAGGDYARLLASWSSPGSKTVSLAAALRFLNMPACTVTHLGVLNAISGGQLLIVKELPAPIVVASSSEFRVPANSVAVTL